MYFRLYVDIQLTIEWNFLKFFLLQTHICLITYLLNFKKRAMMQKTAMTSHESARHYVFIQYLFLPLSLTQFILTALVNSITRIMHGYLDRAVHPRPDPLVISIWITAGFSTHRNAQLSKKDDCVAASSLPRQSRRRWDKRRKSLEIMGLDAFQQFNNLATISIEEKRKCGSCDFLES